MMRFFVMIITIFIITGCNGNETLTNDIQMITDEEKVEINTVFEHWEELINEEGSLPSLASFLMENVRNVSEEEAANMISQFEELQINFLPSFDEKYYDNDIQQQLLEQFEANNEIENVTEGKAGELVKETIASGYKIEMAEGTFFPIIDYDFYREFQPYVSAEWKDYIEIMATESSNVPAKDAAIIISWGELVKRAANQEAFLEEYPSSEKKEDVELLYDKYMMMLLYGLDNTPLFSNNNVVNEEAIEQYERAIQEMDDSNIKTVVKQLLDLIEKNDGNLTEEIEQFRSELVY